MPHRLFCKPPDCQIVYSSYCPEIDGCIALRSLNLETDLPEIHQWVNEAYASGFWQLAGPFEKLFNLYFDIQQNEHAHSYVGLLNGKLICQLDVYSVATDELSHHVSAEPHDCGFHLLMGRNENPIPGLTVSIVRNFLRYYFSFPEANRMYGEPDVNNAKSIALVEKCGMQRLNKIQMSYKEAFLYCLERWQFNQLQQS